MYTIKLFIIRVIKRFNLLKRFNFYLTKKVNGVRIKIPFTNGIGLSNFILCTDWLDSLILAFIDNEERTFVDVGVNIGQTLIRVKSLRPNIKYLGFEPNSTCIAYTQQLVKINKYSNCIIMNAALSSKTEIIILEKRYVDDPAASVVKSLRPAFFQAKEYALAIDYQSSYLNEEICFIKIDVEGAEYEVIKGMIKAIIKHQPIITCEVLDSHNSEVLEFTQERATMVCKLLKSIDYEIIQLHTAKNDKLVSFKKIDEIEIKQWTIESYGLNDYLFYPSGKEQDVLSNLYQICK